MDHDAAQSWMRDEIDRLKAVVTRLHREKMDLTEAEDTICYLASEVEQLKDDNERLRETLTKLASNAIDFSPEGDWRDEALAMAAYAAASLNKRGVGRG